MENPEFIVGDQVTVRTCNGDFPAEVKEYHGEQYILRGELINTRCTAYSIVESKDFQRYPEGCADCCFKNPECTGGKYDAKIRR